MREVEQELKRALARVDAPEGFAERVLARTVAQPRRAQAWYMRCAGIAAMIALAFAGMLGYQRHVRQERAEQAQKLVFALHLTAAKLASIDHRLRDSSSTVHIGEHAREDL
ncbi:MAG TPA: hypothetical protein VFA04_03050 [Bryobacteraceae bacterium]|jgi:hypothetical protein|nr:hypothetical protein [Bryobacteraceae bacterium]